MSTEMRHTEVGVVNLGGLKIDKTVTIMNLVQIALIVFGIGGTALAAYVSWRDQARAVLDLTEQLKEFNDIVNVRITAIETQRTILLQRNDDRLNAQQAQLASLDGRISSVASALETTRQLTDERDVAIRSRIAEIFDELRALNNYLRGSGLSTPSSTQERKDDRG